MSESKNCNIEHLNTLYEKDSAKYFTQSKLSDDGDEIKVDCKLLMKKKAKSYIYLNSHLFKNEDDTIAYYKDDKLIITREKYLNFTIKAIEKPLYTAWLKSTNFYSIIQDPKAEWEIDHEKLKINSFPQPRFKETELDEKIDLSLSKKLIFDLWGRKEKKDSILIINYLKWLLKSERTQYIPYLLGEEGHGKSTIMKMIRALVGMKRYKPVTLEQWSKNFNSHLTDSFFLATDETPELNTPAQRSMVSQAIEKMKNNSTEKTALLELKGKDAIPYDIHVNIFFCSNFPLTQKDMEGRRFGIFPIANRDIMTPKDFATLNKIFEDETPKNTQYLQTLFNWIVKTDFSKVPETEGYYNFKECSEFQKYDLSYSNDYKKEIKENTVKLSYVLLPNYIRHAKTKKNGTFQIKKKDFFDKVFECAKKKGFTVNATTIKQDLFSIGLDIKRGTANLDYI